MKNATISLCAAVAVAVLFAFTGCGKDAESKNEAGTPRVTIAPQSTPVEVEEVKLGAISSVVAATGTITAYRESKIGPKLSGRCERIYVEEGDRIQEGQMLATLDQSSLIIAKKQAQAALATAQATLNKVLAGTRQELIEQAEAALASAEANLEWVHKEFARNESLYRRNVVSEKSFDSITMQLQVAEAQYKKAEEYLEMGIPEGKIQELCLGQSAEIRVDGYPEEVFQGQVSLIRPLIDSQTRTFPVKLEAPNPAFRLKPGMYARVKITLMQKSGTPIISNDSVHISSR